MRCPYCAGENTQVKDSRPTEENAAIRRRRICPDCGGRFTTFERVQLRELIVLKRSGRRVSFDRDKLMRSVHVALRKRPIDRERVEGSIRQFKIFGIAPEAAKIFYRHIRLSLETSDKSYHAETPVAENDQ